MTNYKIMLGKKEIGKIINPEHIKNDDNEKSCYCAGMMVEFNKDIKFVVIK